ncbi:hypothetical protein QFZ63_003874 [Streptomyces sp. B3I7]|uniref:diacylglycerol kinase n=1 Tax=Streptomyces sp. B3I7 TaxID=3042269 RepID=UPI002783583B|nr:diacylglycerol kinase [Streptomyces sp. B3I7]MDQ0812160.1 hypothetical protein [Streptomyces sp. B3I7]
MAEVATTAMTSASPSATSEQLLVVVDAAARRTDGESVRIAKDVLSAGAATKVCLPDGPEEFARALLRRGARRPVVVGDDRALLRTVALLHRRRELAGCALSMVPVGGPVALARSLGLPGSAVAAARAVLDGRERRLDLLVDDSDGVVLGGVRIPSGAGTGAGAGGFPGDGGPEDGWGFGAEAAGGAGRGAAGGRPRPWLRTCRSLVRTLAARPARSGGGDPQRLRVEVDGETVVDLDQPLESVSVRPGGAGGLVTVELRPVSPGAAVETLRATGRRVTVSGADFHYRADDTVLCGPVRTRTWEAREGAWGLTLPSVLPRGG